LVIELVEHERGARLCPSGDSRSCLLSCLRLAADADFPLAQANHPRTIGVVVVPAALLVEGDH